MHFEACVQLHAANGYSGFGTPTSSTQASTQTAVWTAQVSHPQRNPILGTKFLRPNMLLLKISDFQVMSLEKSLFTLAK